MSSFGITGDDEALEPMRSPLKALTAEVDLPLGVAIWVLSAHGLTLLSTLPMVWVLHLHAQALVGRVHSVLLFQVAVAVFTAASAFEIAQNTVDRWYLTPEVGSAHGVGFSDFLFWLLIIAGMALFVVAAVGPASWLLGAALLALFGYPVLYLTLGNPYPALALSGSSACVALYLRFENPWVFFLALGPSAVLMYFFSLLMRTGNQVFHGFATLSSGIGFIVTTWAIDASLRGEPSSWWSFGGCLLVLLVIGVALRPRLRQVGRTERRGERWVRPQPNLSR